MNTPRRQLVRPTVSRPQASPNVQRLRIRLEAERRFLARWMTRLKRAFHAVEKIQRCVVRLETRLSRHEQPSSQSRES